MSKPEHYQGNCGEDPFLKTRAFVSPVKESHEDFGCREDSKVRDGAGPIT